MKETSNDAIREAIAEHLASQSYWRSQKAEEYPEDDRNARAAADLATRAEELRQDDLEPTAIACLKRLNEIMDEHGHDDPYIGLSFNEGGRDVTSGLHLWSTLPGGVPMPAPTLAQILLDIIKATEAAYAGLA